MSNRAKKNLLTVLIIICIAVFAVSAYVLINYYLESKKDEGDFDKLRNLTDTDQYDDSYEARLPMYEQLKAQNSDFVGWLRVYNMRIDYPVMQTKNDPEYYLRRNFEKEYSPAGTPFAANISDIEKPSDIIIIYGHHMYNHNMFGDLQEFKKQDFYEDHKYVRFDTMTERRSYEIVAMIRTRVGTDDPNEFKYYEYADFKNEADFGYFMGEVRAKQYYDTGVQVNYGDELILLSTCDGFNNDARNVVIAKRIPNEEAPAYPPSV